LTSGSLRNHQEIATSAYNFSIKKGNFMATFTQENRQRAVTQVVASWALEGEAPEPDSE